MPLMPTDFLIATVEVARSLAVGPARDEPQIPPSRSTDAGRLGLLVRPSLSKFCQYTHRTSGLHRTSTRTSVSSRKEEETVNMLVDLMQCKRKYCCLTYYAGIKRYCLLCLQNTDMSPETPYLDSRPVSLLGRPCIDNANNPVKHSFALLLDDSIAPNHFLHVLPLHLRVASVIFTRC